MDVLIKSATVFDLRSPYHNRKVDILIKDGLVHQIEQHIDTSSHFEEIFLENLIVSNGWFDGSVCFGEPGYEDRETIVHGIEVAARSGFTQIALNPNNHTPTDSKSIVQYLKSKSYNTSVDIYPIANLSKQSKGHEIAELFDMHQTGAIAFNDYKIGIEDPNLIKIALQYTQNFDGLVMSYPDTQKISNNATVNEGMISVRLGLHGIPSLSEILQISRDLSLLEYTGGRLLIPTISTSKSVDLIRKAKKKGLNVACSVCAHHLALTDDKISHFDSNYKIMPPLRTQSDINALIKGLKDDTIDFITSDHHPINIENKKIEFKKALSGSIGLESLFVSLQKLLGLNTLIKKITVDPQRVFKLPISTIKEGEMANITMFTSEGSSIFSEKDILSTCKNSAFLKEKGYGKIYGTYHNKILTLNE